MTPTRTILIVDDEPQVLMMLQKRLMHAGYRVLTARGPDAALMHARESGVDAMTLDVQLSCDTDGLEIAACLQKDPRTARIPIVFVTGAADEAFKQKCQAVGAKYFLSKPYDADLLLQILKGIFGADELGEIQRISAAKRRQPVDSTLRPTRPATVN